MRKLLGCVVAMTFLSSGVLAENPSDNMEQRVLSELASRSHVAADDLQLVLDDCELNQRNMNLCAFQRAIRAELLLDDAVKAAGAKTDSDYTEWKEQLHARCIDDTEEEAEGGTIMPLSISECKELAMLAERYKILGPESFPPPPQPQHKWD